MEKNLDRAAGIVNQGYLLRESRWKHSRDKALPEPTGYNLSKTPTVIAIPTEATYVKSQPGATPSTTIPEVGKREFPPLLTLATQRVHSSTLSLWSTLSSTSPPSTSPPSTSPPSSTSSSPSGGSRNTQTEIIAGVTTSATVIILVLIVVCILRRKRRYRAAHSASADGAPVSSDVIAQRMPQSNRLSATPQPFLGFPAMRSSSPSKGITADRAKSLLTQNNQGNIEPAVDPFRDFVAAEANQLDVDESQRLRETLDRLQALSGQFEREIQQLGVLAQSGQLSTENRLRVEEIRGTTDLMIPGCPGHEVARNPSSSSSASPPSYHTLHR